MMKSTLFMVILVALWCVATTGFAETILFEDDFTGATLDSRWTGSNFNGTGRGFLGGEWPNPYETDGGAMATAPNGYAFTDLTSIPAGSSVTIEWVSWEHGVSTNAYAMLVVDDDLNITPSSHSSDNALSVVAKAATNQVWMWGSETGGTSQATNVGVKGQWRHFKLTIYGTSGICPTELIIQDYEGTKVGFVRGHTGPNFVMNNLVIANYPGFGSFDNIKVSYETTIPPLPVLVDMFTGTTLDAQWTPVGGFDSSAPGFVGHRTSQDPDNGAHSTDPNGFAYTSLAAIPDNAVVTIKWAMYEHATGSDAFGMVVVDNDLNIDPYSWYADSATRVIAKPATNQLWLSGPDSSGSYTTETSIVNAGTKGYWRQYDLILYGTSGEVLVDLIVRDATGTEQATTSIYTSPDFEMNNLLIAGGENAACWFDNIVISYVNLADIDCGDRGFESAGLSDISGPSGTPDCRIDMYDFAAFAENWMFCNDPKDASCW